jgi:hypothetical protein
MDNTVSIQPSEEKPSAVSVSESERSPDAQRLDNRAPTKPESFVIKPTIRVVNQRAMQSNRTPVYPGETSLTFTTKPRIQPWPYRLKPFLLYIKEAMQWQPQKPFDDTELKFESTRSAAEHNFKILEQYDFNLQEVITSRETANTPLRPGSEFRPIDLLNKILGNHPLWPRARRTMRFGFSMPLDPLQEVERATDVFDALGYGNHKSTQSNPTVVREMLDDEVRHGWQLVLPAESIPLIPGTIVSPLGLVEQITINEHGETTQKWRLIHDQSFQFQSGTSVNNRVQKEKLAQCMYGKALRRFIHAVVQLRLRYPTTPLLMAKFDLKSAYRRAHFSGTTALQSIVTNRGLLGSNTISGDPADTTQNDLAFVSL